MAQPHRRTIPVEVSGVEDAREMLGSLGLALRPWMARRYAPRFAVNVAELFDSARATAARPGTRDTTAKEVLLRRTITVFGGWLAGATLAVEWSSRRPRELAIVTRAFSRPEDGATSVFGVSCVTILGALGLLTPIVDRLERKHRRANELLALQLSACAPEWLSEAPPVEAVAETADAGV